MFAYANRAITESFSWGGVKFIGDLRQLRSWTILSTNFNGPPTLLKYAFILTIRQSE